MYCNYNVTTYPMKIVTTYPKVVFFTRSICQSNTHAHKAVIIPSIYTTGIHFPICQFQIKLDIFCARCIFENEKKNTRRGTNQVFVIKGSERKLSAWLKKKKKKPKYHANNAGIVFSKVLSDSLIL